MNDPIKFVPKRDIRVDWQLIADMIEPGSRVLDVGCDDGQLLAHLAETKNVEGRGLELSQHGVNICVANGLSVVQGNADTDLVYYPDDSFDYAILSKTLQTTHQPHVVLEQLLRIGRRAIVSFPNFAYWRCRTYLAFQGRMPMTNSLDIPWYETPNIHFCTLTDFTALCEEMDVKIEQSVIVKASGKVMTRSTYGAFANFFGSDCIFMLSKKD
ncbi:methionine biosynthesis protein MetW [Sneathiella chungangensis]|uniref:Methionine biosynthesis protein MetW n=1 Tax=Sneathiella chungangensis TaxID=1418234 RepID=A0A845MMB5_9PROT|nr:methionine biosynthesis protein MetW [Sneathiella chungangensis]MZR24240.1 methionine biosynthesis protein MetW [Sneathiella chungangensis]